jgi:hypothetical protein
VNRDAVLLTVVAIAAAVIVVIFALAGMHFNVGPVAGTP